MNSIICILFMLCRSSLEDVIRQNGTKEQNRGNHFYDQFFIISKHNPSSDYSKEGELLSFLYFCGTLTLITPYYFVYYIVG